MLLDNVANGSHGAVIAPTPVNDSSPPCGKRFATASSLAASWTPVPTAPEPVTGAMKQ
jgi:hypothetical protein